MSSAFVPMSFYSHFPTFPPQVEAIKRSLRWTLPPAYPLLVVDCQHLLPVQYLSVLLQVCCHRWVEKKLSCCRMCLSEIMTIANAFTGLGIRHLGYRRRYNIGEYTFF
ncbi:MAG: hypothetical protein KME50_29980 [Nostoc desertorum CM1-VF14]|nr:hypothetical protein [Nostoc desertorum CM1-VF14]